MKIVTVSTGDIIFIKTQLKNIKKIYVGRF